MFEIMQQFDSDCTSQAGMMAAMTAHSTYDPDVIIGPPCAAAMATVANYASFHNIPLLSWHNPDPEFDPYTNMIRLQPPMKSLATALTHTLQERGQHQVSVVYAGTEPYTVLKDSVNQELPASNIQVANVQRYDPGLSAASIDQMLINMKNYGKTIVLMASSEDVRNIMLAAERTGMTAEQFNFIHLDPQVYTSTELRGTVLGEGYWKRGDLMDNTARQAYSSLSRMIFDPMNDDKTPTVQSPKSRYEEFSALASKMSQATGDPGRSDVYSQFLYDAVSAWAVLANQMLLENVNIKDGLAMADRVKPFRAEGATGHISMDRNADRTAKVFELAMDPVGAFTPSKILQFDTTTNLYDTQIVKQAKPKPQQTSQFGMSATTQQHFDAPPLGNHLQSTPLAMSTQFATSGTPTYLDGPSIGTGNQFQTSHLATSGPPQYIGAATTNTLSVTKPPALSAATTTLSKQTLPPTAPSGTAAVAAVESLNAIISRLAKLEAAITKVINHDHRTDHPPHELPQPVSQPQYHPPATNTHMAAASAPLAHAHAPSQSRMTSAHAHASGPLAMAPNIGQNIPSARTVQTAQKTHFMPSSNRQTNKPMVTGSMAAKATTSGNTVDTLTSQILNKLTGVIDQRLSQLGAAQGGASGETPRKKSRKAAADQKQQQQQEAPAKSSNGGGGGGNGGEKQAMNQDYAEMIQRLREEISPELGLFMNFPPFLPGGPPHMGPPNTGRRGQQRAVAATTTPQYWPDYAW